MGLGLRLSKSVLSTEEQTAETNSRDAKEKTKKKLFGWEIQEQGSLKTRPFVSQNEKRVQ